MPPKTLLVISRTSQECHPPHPPERQANTPALPNEIPNSIGMKLVLIPAGEFLMGLPDDDRTANRVEKPQHRVRITRPFYLGVHEVTQTQYKKVMGNNPSWFSARRREGRARGPVDRSESGRERRVA